MQLRRRRRWIALALFGLSGALFYFYGLSQGALLLSACGSLSPPFYSFRCAQPYVATIVGLTLFVLSFLGICLDGLVALYRVRKARARTREGKMGRGS